MKQLELRDIHLPDGSLWWPLAPGWWLLLALLLIAALVMLWLAWRRRHQPLKKLSMSELEQIRQAYHGGQDERTTVNAVARLLRRTLISYRGRRVHAASTGNSWLIELEQLAPNHGFSTAQLQLLAHDRYQSAVECDVDSLLQACESWIRKLPRGQAHVSA